MLTMANYFDNYVYVYSENYVCVNTYVAVASRKRTLFLLHFVYIYRVYTEISDQSQNKLKDSKFKVTNSYLSTCTMTVPIFDLNC